MNSLKAMKDPDSDILDFPTEERRRDPGNMSVVFLLKYLIKELELRNKNRDQESNVAQILVKVIELFKCLLAHSSEPQIIERIRALVTHVENFDMMAEGLVQAAYRQIEEIAAELEALEKNPRPTGSHVSLEEIDAELERRETKRERVASTQEDLENEIAHLEEEIKTAELKIRLSDQPAIDRKKIKQQQNLLQSKKKTLEGLIGGISKNDEEVETLKQYRSALDLTRTGLPEGLIEKKKITPEP